MRILVCGASGCVGSAVARALRSRGHQVVEAVRAPAAGTVKETIALDFMQPVSPDRWAARLLALRIDTVVNCVGILMAGEGSSFERIHCDGPVELFAGAAAAGVRRVVQISALGVGPVRSGTPGTPYLHTKRLADEALLRLPVDAAVVRPSLVFGPRSESGRLFATLASLPVIGLPGRGLQRVQPLHVYELAECVAMLVECPGRTHGVHELGGGATLTYRQMLAAYRAAEGFGDALWLPVPMAVMRATARVAERVPQRVFSRDTMAMLARGTETACNAAPALLGRAPATLAEGLVVTPPQPAIDLHVHLAAPVVAALRASLAFLWIYIALVSALLPHQSGVLELLARCGLSGDAGWVALATSCVLNLSIGMATLLRPAPVLYALQAAAIVGYTATAAFFVPSLTIDHCGPLAKNVPLLMCVLVLWLADASTPVVAKQKRRARSALTAAASSTRELPQRPSAPVSVA